MLFECEVEVEVEVEWAMIELREMVCQTTISWA
jgi:hypothetical protein